MSSSGSSSAPSDKELPSSGAKSSGSGHARPGHQDEQGERRPVTTAAALSHEGGHDSPTVQARMSRVNLVCCALLVLLVPGLLGSALTLIALPSCLNRKEESDATGTVAAIPEKLFQLPLDDISSPNLKLGKDVDCRNHIRVVQPIRDGSTLYICGTNARAPTDWQIQAADLTLVPAANQVPVLGINTSNEAQGRCPNYLHQSSQTLWLDDAPSMGSSCVVALTVLSTDQYGFFRLTPRGFPLRSTDTRAIQKPHVVGAFSTAEHAYFVFREEGIERKACGARNVSTLARLCKTLPTGFPIWRTACSLAPSSPSLPSTTDSAVCAFLLRDVEHGFGTSTFYDLIQRDDYTLSRPLHISQVLSPRPGMTCPSGPRNLSTADTKFWLEHPLVTQVPKQRYDRPFYAHSGVAFRSLVAFVLNETWGAWVVCYVATGAVLKLAEESAAAGQIPAPARLVDTFKVTAEPIRKMLVSVQRRSLYVFSDDDVRQYRLDACEGRHADCPSCLLDPFCGWDGSKCLPHVVGCAHESHHIYDQQQAYEQQQPQGAEHHSHWTLANPVVEHEPIIRTHSHQQKEDGAYRPLYIGLGLAALLVSAMGGSMLTALVFLASSHGTTPDTPTVDGGSIKIPEVNTRATSPTSLLISTRPMPSTTRQAMVKLPVKVFTRGKLYYRSAHLDDDRGHLFVGAMDHLFKLRLGDISGPPLQLGKDVDCRNHIREVQADTRRKHAVCLRHELQVAHGLASVDDAPSPGNSTIVAMWRLRNGRSAIYRAAVPNMDPNKPSYSFLLSDPADTAKFNGASYWLPDLENGVLLGAFVTFNHGYPDSAVCAFRLEDIERAFNGTSFYELSLSRNSPSKIVRPDSAAYPGTGSTCVPDSRTLPPTGPDYLASHPLLAVPPKERHERPFFALPGVTFSGVAAMVLKEAWGSWLVCYVATETGLVMKVAEEIIAGGQAPAPSVLVDEFNTTAEPIRKMLVSTKHRNLYVFSDSDIRQYRLDACEERHLDCRACVRDPFCGWDGTHCVPHVGGCV
ncbi:hypothetical protein HPB49_021176 [Dermacentor silvarum]|uniref:Uncharacterized protein n=1 Tax=Dermacentor silvarum TaxID=543639 RepID=A0ACB8DG27_DERSI|nr:hypothetical protein HPB49_021176 [Dermacentor silvarum]